GYIATFALPDGVVFIMRRDPASFDPFTEEERPLAEAGLLRRYPDGIQEEVLSYGSYAGPTSQRTRFAITCAGGAISADVNDLPVLYAEDPRYSEGSLRIRLSWGQLWEAGFDNLLVTDA